MSLMLKLLTTISLLSINLYAGTLSVLDKKVIEYEKKRISLNSRYELKDVNIYLKKELASLNGWTGYVLQINLLVNKKTIKIKDILYTNGTAITPELKDLEKGKDYKDLLSPSMPDSYYDNKHLIAGDQNATNKIVVFSDPLCPFCIDYIPEVIKHIEENNNIALYYYHFPLLRIHPASNVITKAMVVAHNKGIKNVVSKIYNAKFEDSFEADEKDIKKILKEINKALDSNITITELSSQRVLNEIKNDNLKASDMLVSGTPTIFINGEVDRTRKKFKTLK
jgi:thiol:disulfide interchange protein DsbC